MIFLAPGEFGRGGDLERLAVDIRAAVPARHPADWNRGFVAPRVRRHSEALRQVNIDRNVEGLWNPDQDRGAAAHDRLGLGPGIKEIIHTDWAPTQWNDCTPTIYGAALRLCTSLP